MQENFARKARAKAPRPPRTLRVSCVIPSSRSLLKAAALLVALDVDPASAQDDPFSDTRDGGKLHTASGFLCPSKVGLFERDAVGEAEPTAGADFCAYSALDGVYGTVKLTLLDGPYNAPVSLAPEFIEEEGTGAKRIAEGMISLPVAAHGPPLAIYTRTYETGKMEDRHYRVLFSGAQFKNWAVEATIEYVDPQDVAVESEFLRAVYAGAEKQISGR